MDSNDEGEGGWDEEPDADVGLVKKYSEAQSFKTKDFVVWTIDQIEDRQKKIIEEAIDLLSLSENDAITALKHFNWNPEKLQENWFDNEEKTRKTCGLTPLKFLVSRNMDKQDLCYICYQKLQKSKPRKSI